MDYEQLRDHVSGRSAAFRAKVELQPADGPGGKVFPPTYADATFVEEQRRIDGEVKHCILLDSVPSQANRLELALLQETRRDPSFELPLITLDFGDGVTDRRISVTSLEAPHRMADALFRDSLLNGVSFRRSDVGKSLDVASPINATAVFGYCPTALILGMWDSQRLHGGIGPKFTRAIVSEIIAIDAVPGKKVASRIDPVPISAAKQLYKAKDTAECIWTLDPDAAKKKGNTPELMKKKGRPSEVVLGNIAPSITDGGITMSRAAQTVVLSFAVLRQLQFPINGTCDPVVDDTARTVLAALGLCAVALAHETGYFLRSRCHLWPTDKLRWQSLEVPGQDQPPFEVDSKTAKELFRDSLRAANDAGLPWSAEISLQPSPALRQLVTESHDLVGQGEG